MCGIVGLAAFGKLPKGKERIRQESMMYLATKLLQVTETRGKDATGVATLFDKGDYMGLKMGVQSSEFISRFGADETTFSGYLDLWRQSIRPANIFLGHCRKSSVGNSTDNVNNHPIKVGEIVGIHNGTLKNHNIIIKNLGGKRDGVVDSEAIFRLVNHYTNKGTEPFTADIILEVAKKLEGQYACLSFNGNNPFQLAAFRDGRPMEFAYIRPLQLLLIASEKKFFDSVFCDFNREVNLFGNKKNFPHLSVKDVDFKWLTDDSLAIFDLTTEVNDGTKVVDLMSEAKIPRLDKEWTTVTKVNSVVTPPKRVVTAGSTANTQTSTTSTKKTGRSKKKPVGRVWNKDLTTFSSVDEAEFEKTKAALDVTLDTTGATDDHITKKPQPQPLTEAANIENTLTDAAKIIELPYEATAKKGKEDPAQGESSNKTVDMTVDAEAIELSVEGVKTMERYENNEEVIVELKVNSEDVLKTMPLFALANKFRKLAYRLGFEHGIVAYKKKNGGYTAQGPVDNTDDSSEKISKAHKSIRVLKTVATMVSMIVGRALPLTSSDFHEKIDRAVTDELGRKGELSSQTFDTIFTAGDLRTNPTLRQVKRTLKMKENKS